MLAADGRTLVGYLEPQESQIYFQSLVCLISPAWCWKAENASVIFQKQEISNYFTACEISIFKLNSPGLLAFFSSEWGQKGAGFARGLPFRACSCHEWQSEAGSLRELASHTWLSQWGLPCLTSGLAHRMGRGRDVMAAGWCAPAWGSAIAPSSHQGFGVLGWRRTWDDLLTKLTKRKGASFEPELVTAQHLPSNSRKHFSRSFLGEELSFPSCILGQKCSWNQTRSPYHSGSELEPLNLVYNQEISLDNLSTLW